MQPVHIYIRGIHEDGRITCKNKEIPIVPTGLKVKELEEKKIKVFDIHHIEPGEYLLEKLPKFGERKIMKEVMSYKPRFIKIKTNKICEKLTHLQQRPKWTLNAREFQVGDLCIVREDFQPHLKWKLGRVMEVLPGPDGHVRVVT